MEKATKSLIKRIAVIFTIFTVICLVSATTTLIVFKVNRLSFFIISGDSMNPTVKNGDIVLLKKDSTPKKNDLIFFQKPASWINGPIEKTPKQLIKRLWGQPGDEIKISAGVLTIAGKQVYSLKDEDYSCKKSEFSYKLTDTQYFVMGDNRKNSIDSLSMLCRDIKDFYVDKSSVNNHGTLVFHL